VSRPLRLLGWLAAAAALAALAVFGLAQSRSAANGRVAPALPRQALTGAPVTLKSVLAGIGGRPMLVLFWASWCTPCIQEAPAVERFASSPAGRGRLVGVDYSDPVVSGAREFVKRFAWTFPNLRDGEGFVGNAYHIPNLPTTFVIDGHGRIRATLHGPQTQHSLEAALAGVART
jgi:cytochrome c biogenesis protein CcmG/thiol:disulfide interchange protein DsbE